MKASVLGDKVEVADSRLAWADALLGSPWMLMPVLALGLLFRLWDIAQPFIGYHMWNEVFYVTIARNFEHFGLLAPYNYDSIAGLPLSLRLGPSPFVPWLIYLARQAFGSAEWVARLPMLILGLLSIVAMYGITRELYGHRIALGSTFFAAIMPGIVFYSRHAALDSPMVAFGLGAVWTLLLARRTRRLVWALTSALMLGLAVLGKYTGVLFVPVLAWIWLSMMRQPIWGKKWSKWILPVAFFVIAALPAGTWFLYGLLAASSRSDAQVSSYLLRLSELGARIFLSATMATWNRFADQVGGVLWYPMLILIAVVLTTKNLLAIAKRHVCLILLIVPWFLQMAYPSSWYSNDSYTFPVLYGIAIILALLLTELSRIAPRLSLFSGRSLIPSVALVGILILVSSLMDYRRVYHSWYSPVNPILLQHPANAVTHEELFLSAKFVKNTNVEHESILADLPSTLYYAQDECWEEHAMWQWWGFEGGKEKMIQTIRSREFAFVVYTQQPPLDVTYALVESGYRRIAPAAWRKIKDS
jgi:4-amino-4-deoxy-L-arabinose transferase-like glycosyltransferase